MLIDSHMHFDDFEKEGEVDAVLARAEAAQVEKIVAIGGTQEANTLALDLSRRYPGRVYATAGYDRDEVGQHPDMGHLRALLEGGDFSAVGETGLDYHYSPETAEAQQELFQSMLDLAITFNLPVVVHSRDAEQDMYAILKRHAERWTGEPGRWGVLHCFTGDADTARALAELGMMISFSGILTFKSAGSIREAAAIVPDDQMLIETDAPYLAPVPYRGKRNEPAYVAQVAQCLAEVRAQPLEQIAEQTSRNAAALFRAP